MTLDITINITFCSQPKFNPVKLHYLMLLSGKISSNVRLNVLLIGKLTPNRFLLFFFLILINQNKILSGGFKKKFQLQDIFHMDISTVFSSTETRTIDLRPEVYGPHI